MGFEDDSNDLPAPIEKGYWVKIETGENVLRPRWNKSWSENKSWHAALYEKVQKCGIEKEPTTKKSFWDNLSDTLQGHAKRKRFGSGFRFYTSDHLVH